MEDESTPARTITLTTCTNGVAVLTFDTPASPVNIISRSLFDEFADAVQKVESDPDIRAVALVSAKRDGFIAGANVKEFLAMTEPSEGESFSRVGHKLLDRIASSTKPYVAAIHGAVFGGGLEVALACHYRLATDDPKTVLALPEVTLGLLPGGGGTQRLPELVGLASALPIILTGQRIRAKKALRMGLVDALVPPFGLTESAVEAASRLADGRLSRRVRKPRLADRVMEAPVVRSVVIGRARHEVLAKTRGNYPAPLAALACVEKGLSSGRAAGDDAESVGFGQLTASSQAKALIGLFLATTDLKRPKRLAAPKTVGRIGVLGAGLMGAGIAGVSLSRYDVVLRDITMEAVGKGVRSINDGLVTRVRSGSLSRLDADRQRSRLVPTTALASVSKCELVIEAVFEDLELKRSVLAEVEQLVSDETVFATNTSALPIHEIAANARHPERVVGMHYFSPVHKMQLLEVVAAGSSADWAVETARSVGIAQGKTVIVVKDGPGFYTTRILAPFLGEAARLLEEGATVGAIDSALKDAGYPMGPLGLLDEVGIDVGAHVSEFLGKAFEARGLAPTDALARMATAGYAGRKNGKGFYRYDLKKPKTRPADERVYEFFGDAPRREIPAREMAERLMLLMVNEAAYCLEEGILSSPVDGDVGAVLGIGFPPFLGGPFRYVDGLSAEDVVGRLFGYASRLGPRFRPAKLLVDAANAGTRFYPRG